LNFPTRSRALVVNLVSAYASRRTVVPPPKSGMIRKSTNLKAVPSTMGTARRTRNVSVATGASPWNSRPSIWT
jgi:hypothetical protein